MPEDGAADRESKLDQRSLDFKEREIAAKERELALKEKELQRSGWLSPTVLGLFGAAIGLAGSVIVARVNNSTTQDVERLRAQSEIILDAIKTGTGNTDAACKNLTFLVALGLIRDSEGRITSECKAVYPGPPSLPANASAPQGGIPNNPGNTTANNPGITGNPPSSSLDGVIRDGSSGTPISGAEVATKHSRVMSDSAGLFHMTLPNTPSGYGPIPISVTRGGYVPVEQYVSTGEQTVILLNRAK